MLINEHFVKIRPETFVGDRPGALIKILLRERERREPPLGTKAKILNLIRSTNTSKQHMSLTITIMTSSKV